MKKEKKAYSVPVENKKGLQSLEALAISSSLDRTIYESFYTGFEKVSP